MRACIVGAGLAGSLLAWRLARATTGWRIDLVAGDRRPGTGDRRPDATAVSGGAVRVYEPEPEQRRLAVDSMVELMGSRTLREWAGYRTARTVYLGQRHDTAALADIEAALPGWAQVATPAELAQEGWADVPGDAVAVVEPGAGFTSPDQLREAVLADGPVRRAVTVHEGTVDAITPREDGTVACTVAGQVREYDLVVIAAGPWTPALLRASGLPADGYRTKSIQYTVYRTGDWRPPVFIDGVAGLYGRPTADGGLLLGQPSQQWDVDPDRPPVTPDLHDEAARLAGIRFPRLRIGEPVRRVGAADCYAAQPILSLRPVQGSGLFTFSGGAGGSVKTALAASHRAATQLESGNPLQLASVGLRKGQP